MRHCRLYFALTLSAILGVSASPPAPPESPPDETLLKFAGVSVDAGGLLKFFRRQTLSDADVKQVHELIGQLGAENFDTRENASKSLRQFGPRAAPLVRGVLPTLDPEASRRAHAFLDAVSDPPPPAPTLPPPPPTLVMRAAARQLACHAPPDAVPVLLAYLPSAGDLAVEDEVFDTLLRLTGAGKPDTALTAALDDTFSIRRAAAAHVLGRKGDADQRAAVRKLLSDADPRVRWNAAMSLLSAHDRRGAEGLLSLLTNGPQEWALRADEVLRRLAGEKAPDVTMDDSPIIRRKCREAWAAWWKENGAGVDLAYIDEGGPLLGYTLGVEYNTGRVWECNPDGSIRWELRDLPGPMDAQVLPNGHVLIAEADTHRITERDLKGTIIWEKKIDGEPNDCRRLPDGNIFVSTPRRAMEFTPDGAAVYSIEVGSGAAPSNAVRKGRDGYVYYTWDGGIMEVDEVTRPIRHVSLLPRAKVREVLYVGLQDLPGDRFLLADSRQSCVLEVDGAGKILWQADVPAACGVERLPNGHTLVSMNHKVIELDGDGKQVWSKSAEGYVRRVHRR